MSAPSPQAEAQPLLEQETLQRLSRENFYYRTSNRELKRKLREAGQQAEQEQAGRAQLEAELHNLRSFLGAHPGATPTRLFKNELREVPG